MPLAGHGLRPTPLRRRASRPQLKRDPLGGEPVRLRRVHGPVIHRCRTSLLSFVTASIGVLGCRPSAPRSSGADSIPVSVARADTSRPRKTPFDATGYYFPTEPIIVGDYEVAFLHIDSTSSVILLRDSANSAPVACRDAVVSPDTLHLKCDDPALGAVTFDGSFVEKRGSFDAPDIDPGITLVLSATTTV